MRIKAIILSACLVVAASCTKSETENMYNTQATKIEAYVEKYLDQHPDTRVDYKDGIVRMVLAEGEGSELTGSGTATILYAGYDFSGSQINANSLFMTNDPDIAAGAKWVVSDESIFTDAEICLSDSSILDGLRKGLEGAHEGEQCLILFTGKFGFRKQIGTISANAPQAWMITIKEVKN